MHPSSMALTIPILFQAPSPIFKLTMRAGWDLTVIPILRVTHSLNLRILFTTLPLLTFSLIRFWSLRVDHLWLGNRGSFKHQGRNWMHGIMLDIAGSTSESILLCRWSWSMTGGSFLCGANLTQTLLSTLICIRLLPGAEITTAQTARISHGTSHHPSPDMLFYHLFSLH